MIYVRCDTSQKSFGRAAKNQQAGYQAANNPMEQGVHVQLSELKPIANVIIKIGPRPAEILLDVVERSTGNHIGAFVVRWMRIDDDPVTATNSIKNRVFVTPNVELLLTVQSPGYVIYIYLLLKALTAEAFSTIL